MSSDKDVTIRKDSDRYVMELGGKEVGEAVYEVTEDGVEIPHTSVDPSLRGSGLGGKMVGLVLDDIRSTSTKKVIPTCPFVARWIQKHPEYRDLVTR